MTPPLIKVPDEGAGLHVVASVSGGKDSTALILALREACPTCAAEIAAMPLEQAQALRDAEPFPLRKGKPR